MKRRIAAAALASALALTSAQVAAGAPQVAPTAETTRLAQGDPSGTNPPRRGYSMGQVERGWGAPKDKLAPVGRPPITRWVYDGFTVYFEHQHVIHSVVHTQRRTST